MLTILEMSRLVVGSFAVLSAIATMGCDGDTRRLEWDADILRFDAAMLQRDAAMPQLDAGMLPVDAGRPLGNEGDACESSSECAPSLECLDRLCAALGGLDQPCRPGNSCDSGLACDGTACRATIQGRFCHCVYETATMARVRLEMQIGTVVLGPTLTETCSPCVEIPIGSGIPYAIRREGSTSFLDTGSLNLTADVPELGFAFSVGGVVAGPIACDRAPTGFCGT